MDEFLRLQEIMLPLSLLFGDSSDKNRNGKDNKLEKDYCGINETGICTKLSNSFMVSATWD